MKNYAGYYNWCDLSGFVVGCYDYRSFITYRILNIADLTVEGSIAMGAAIAAQGITMGLNPFLATALALAGAWQQA